MPTWSFAGAVLELLTQEPEFLEKGCWTEFTGLEATPWVDGHAYEPWTANNGTVLGQVRAFVRMYEATKGIEKRRKLIASTAANAHAAGRHALLVWMKDRKKACRFNDKIWQYLESRACSPYDILRNHGDEALPEAENCDEIQGLMSGLVISLFGLGASKGGGGQSAEPWARKFMSQAMTTVFRGQRKRMRKELMGIKAAAVTAEEKWNAFQDQPDETRIQRYVEALKTHAAVARRFGDHDAIAEFNKQIERLVLFRETLRTKVIHFKGLPAKVVEELKLLAQSPDGRRLINQISEFVPETEEDTENVERLELDTPVGDLDNWQTGVEFYQDKDMDYLWAAIGREKEKSLPWFNQDEDCTGLTDPWTDEGEQALRGKNSRPLLPRWHQLVGICKLLDNFLEGKPTLLMDAVGVGKTMQIIGFFACLAWFREHYEKYGKFPGKYAKIQFCGHGNVPNHPHLLVVPLSLSKQVRAEVHRYLQRYTFDFMTYDTSVRGAWGKAFWDAVASSHQVPVRKIVLATLPAIQKDASDLFVKPSRSEWGKGKFKPLGTQHDERVARTIFSQRFCAMAQDEIHESRRVNWQYVAVRTIRESAGGIVGMTATPIITSPMDLGTLGYLVGNPKFLENDTQLDGHRKELARELNKDRRLRSKAEQKAAEPDQLLGASAAGSKFPNYIAKVATVMEDMRLRGVLPSREIPILLRLSEFEREAQRAIAKNVKRDVRGTPQSAEKNFYVQLRQNTMHPSLVPDTGAPMPFNIEEFEENPTAKLQALMRIIKHHQTPRAKPLINNPEYAGKPLSQLPPFPDANELVTDEDYEYVSYAEGLPDKIIVFSNFPSNNVLLEPLITSSGIKALFYNGSVNSDNRHEIIQTFKDAGPDGPNVLMMSSVGMSGLNVDCANIIIFADTTWSAQLDEQAIGRLLRFGQTKDVLVYRLICLGSADVILNGIAAIKGIAHRCFLECDLELKQALESLISTTIENLIDDEAIEDNSEEVEEEDGEDEEEVPKASDDDIEPATDGPKGNKKGKGKRTAAPKGGKRGNAKAGSSGVGASASQAIELSDDDDEEQAGTSAAGKGSSARDARTRQIEKGLARLAKQKKVQVEKERKAAERAELRARKEAQKAAEKAAKQQEKAKQKGQKGGNLAPTTVHTPPAAAASTSGAAAATTATTTTEPGAQPDQQADSTPKPPPRPRPRPRQIVPVAPLPAAPAAPAVSDIFGTASTSEEQRAGSMPLWREGIDVDMADTLNRPDSAPATVIATRSALSMPPQDVLDRSQPASRPLPLPLPTTPPRGGENTPRYRTPSSPTPRAPSSFALQPMIWPRTPPSTGTPTRPVPAMATVINQLESSSMTQMIPSSCPTERPLGMRNEDDVQVDRQPPAIPLGAQSQGERDRSPLSSSPLTPVFDDDDGHGESSESTPSSPSSRKRRLPSPDEAEMQPSRSSSRLLIPPARFGEQPVTGGSSKRSSRPANVVPSGPASAMSGRSGGKGRGGSKKARGGH